MLHMLHLGLESEVCATATFADLLLRGLLNRLSLRDQ